MANDIIITPVSASIQFSGSANSTIKLTVDASGSLSITGNSGSLFSITDNMSGSLMSVNTIAGLPILEVFSDNRVNIGKYASEAIKIQSGGSDVALGSGSVMFVTSSGRVGIGTTNPVNKLDVAGNISCSVITASNFFGTSSWASNALTASNVNGGTNTYLARWTGNTSLSTGLIRDNGTDLGIGIAPDASFGVYHIRTSPETVNETAGYWLSLTNPRTGSVVSQTFRAHSTYNAPTASSITGICSDFLSYTQVNSSGSLYGRIWQFYAGGFVLTGSVTDKTSFYAANAAIGAGATVATEHGLYVSGLTAGTTIYGIRSIVATSTNRWNLYIDGTAKNYIAGNVGIGITNPSYKLDVSGGDVNIASANILKFGTVSVLNTTNNANDIYANIRVLRNESTVNQDGMYINYNSSGTTTAHLRFYANGVNERMRIDASSGNVGIGSASPGAVLDVTGDARFTGNVGIGGLAGTDTNGNAVKLTLIGLGNTTTAMKFQSVNGIGTTSTGAKVFKGFIRVQVDSTVTDGVSPFASGLYFLPLYQ